MFISTTVSDAVRGTSDRCSWSDIKVIDLARRPQFPFRMYMHVDGFEQQTFGFRRDRQTAVEVSSDNVRVTLGQDEGLAVGGFQ